MRVLILGAGGTGGYFGGRLFEAGRDVSFLVRPKRAQQLRANGLVLKSPFGDASLKVPVIESVDPGMAFDLIILSNKSYDLDAAMNAIAPAVERGALVLPLLNGMRHLDALDARFGRERVLGGWAAISATLDPDGTVRHLSEAQTLQFGDRDGSRAARMQEIEDLAAGAKFELRARPEIVQEMWEKWTFLSTLAGITCLMRASIGTIMDAPGGEGLITALLEECRRVAAAYGFTPRDDAYERARGMLTQRGSTFTASMLRDIENGGRTEAGHVLGDLLERARVKCFETPLLAMAYCHVKTYEIKNRIA